MGIVCNHINQGCGMQMYPVLYRILKVSKLIPKFYSMYSDLAPPFGSQPLCKNKI